MKQPDTPAGLWKERYENLRRHFLDNRQTLGTDPLGLTLFLSRGVAGWMRTWATMPAASAAGAPSVRPVQQLPYLTSEWQHQLTVVLAQMAARHLPAAPSL